MTIRMDSRRWNNLIAQLPRPHLLQTWEWAQAKQAFGWEAHYRTWEDDNGELQAAAQILQRHIQLPLFNRSLCMLYVPKGPLLRDWSDAALRQRVLDGLVEFGRELGAFFIKIDPDVILGTGIHGEEGAVENTAAQALVADFRARGWRYSNEQVQMPNTMLIDLEASEDELLGAMKQKTRYNVRLAGRKGVTVRKGGPQDFPALYQMYAETSVRDGFVIRSEDYYRAVWEQFFAAEMLTPLIAEVEGEPVAALMLFIFREQAWYIYGMSRDLHRDMMPNYLLQWEAIRAAKEAGCEVYDLWGAPDEFNENDPMWGVYRFKQGLAAYEARHIGAWDLPLQPWIYRIYAQVLPRVIALMRWRGRRLTQGQVQGGLEE
ncbi:MAG: peptidoglycan bridge formation glycyltransferase FemA/FemB family protein [Chloroflexi bacterium]|nr:peptidoglycan bridge formation glycyltransferase FemA/FemB family protein [Chloroflexota bacterium]